MQEQLSSRWIQSEDNLTQVMAESPQQALQEIQPRRRSLFDIRAPFASDRFSREVLSLSDFDWFVDVGQSCWLDIYRSQKHLQNYFIQKFHFLLVYLRYIFPPFILVRRCHG
jgi:hypothetical protein